MVVGSDEMMTYAIESGMIDPAQIERAIEEKERRELLAEHGYAVWQKKDGRWGTYFREEGGRRLKVCRSREKLEDAIVEFMRARRKDPTLQKAFDEYNDGRLSLGQISEATHMRYGQYFKTFFDPVAQRRIGSFTAPELCDFMERRVSELDLTCKAFTNVKCIAKGVFKRAYRNGTVKFRIVEEVLQVLDLSERCFRKVKKEDRAEVFTEEEYVRYVSFLCENLDAWNAALLLIMITGMRGGEAVSLSPDDLCLEEDVFLIRVRRTETRYLDGNGRYAYKVKESPKTDAGIREAIVPRQYNWLYGWLLQHCGEEYLFTGRWGKRITTNSLRRRQELNCQELGFYHKSPHKGRKTYATILLDNNVDANVIIQQMGHADVSTTERFYHKNMKNHEKKARIISGIEIFDAQ